MATTPEALQLSQDIQQLSRVFRDMISSSSRTVAAQQANYLAQMDVNDQLDAYKKQLSQGKALTKQQQKQLEEAVKAKKKELEAQKLLDRRHKEYIETINSATASEARKANAAKAAQRAQEALNDATKNTASTAKSYQDSMGGFVKGVNISGAALAWFGATLKTAIFHAKEQIVANQGMVEGTGSLVGALADQQSQARKFGMTGADFAKVVSANRQMVNAMGGTAQATKQVQSSMDSFYAMTGDNAAAFQALTESMTSFANKGVRPTQVVLEGYTSDIKTLAAQTGMAQDAARRFYDDIASDADSIDLLRSARKEERAAILASQRAMVQQSIAAGMSAEQAKEAAKMLNKMVAAKPLDRLKQAAKVRALGGAMGIQGSELAAQAITAGKRATAEQKKALAEFSQNAANAMDQAAGQGLGSEIFASQLVEKLDLDQYYGKSSVFSTTLGDTLAKPLDDVKTAYVDASKSTALQVGRQIDLAASQLANIIKGNDFLGVIASGVTAIGALMLTGKLGDIIGKGASKALSAGKNLLGLGGKAAGAVAGAEAAGAATTVASTAGKAAGAAGTATTVGQATNAAAGTANTAGQTANAAGQAAGKAGALSKVASVAKKVGVAGAALDVGMGINDLAHGKAQTEMPKGWDTISPMRWGMYAGDKVNKGAEAVMGQSIGSKLFDMFNPDAGKFPSLPTPAKKKDDPAVDAAKRTAESNLAIKTATLTSADNIAAQVKKMDTSNDFLKKIAEMAERQIELAEKQLIALTLTEKEKANKDTKSQLRSDNKFGSKYNYV